MAPKSVSVTVKYSKPGTQPPVFLAGSFSDPAWHPQEMQYSTDEAGEHDFYKEVQVEEGIAYQYKFRIGEGDWMLNEDSPTVTDDVGNRNNLLSVPVSEEQTTEPKHDEHPPVAEEATPHPIPEMVDTMPEQTAGDTAVEHASIETKDEKPVEETAEEQQAEPKEHATITPAHTNTPVPETVDGASETNTPEAVEIPEESQLNAHHDHEDAQLSATPTDSAPSQQAENQNTSEFSTQIASGTFEPTSTPAVQQESPETIASPTLIVEKVDDELRHGDDFGSAATVGQKDAHLLRSQDAVPDQVITRSESRTPELAETAAEVAESAALLDRDRDPPTPPISDEEAGRIGYRRMSSTPIPEVAKTAAEVADVAATLHDRPALHLETAPEASGIINDDEDLLDSGASTPESQKAPRFSYECLGEEDIGVPALPTHSRSPTDPLEPVRSPYEEPVVVDWNDPSIEMFPTDRASIIHTIRRLTEQIPEDVPDLDIVPPSPVIGPNGQIQEGRSPLPSPAVIAHQISPSLDSITEENDELGETLASLPAVSKLASKDSDKENTTLNKWLNNSTTISNGEDNIKLHSAREVVEPETIQSAEVESEKPKLAEAVEQTKDELQAAPLSAEVGEETREPEVSSTSKIEGNTAEEPDEAPIVELPEGSGEPELTSKEQREETATAPEEISSKVKEVPAESPPPEFIQQASSEEVQIPSVTTPFVVSDKQLGHEDEAREITTDGDSPNITVQPATPAALKTEFIPKPLDTAKTTAIEEENGRQVKSRKNPRSQSPERPITPSSMRSATRDTKSKNFLGAFWRVVFVDWIGGLIRALCGGRGAYTLLAVSAIVMVVFAPTLYSSYTGSSLWG